MTQATRRRRVLIVEDEPAILETYGRALSDLAGTDLRHAAALGFAVYLRWLALVILPERAPREPEAVTRTGTAVAVVAGLVLLTATVLPVLLLGAGTR